MKQLITYFKMVEGIPFPLAITFCRKHERELGRFTGTLSGSSEDDEVDPASECDVCEVSPETGYLASLIEKGHTIGMNMAFKGMVVPKET